MRVHGAGLVFVIGAFIVLASAQAASSAPIRVTISGSIDSINDPDGLLPTGVVDGAAFSGEYVFDSEPAGPPNFLAPNLGSFSGGALSSISIEIGGHVFTRSTPEVLIGDDLLLQDGRTADLWTLGLLMPGEVAPSVGFLDETLARIDDPSQYFVASSLAGWTTAEAGIYYANAATGTVDELALGAIDSIRVIPEPSSALLIALGLGGLARRGIRRRVVLSSRMH